MQREITKDLFNPFFCIFPSNIVKKKTFKPMDLENEDQLVKESMDGDVNALALLSEHYFPFVFRRVWISVPNNDAEDVTQEVFVSVVQKIAFFKKQSKFSTWLFAITYNKIADYYRKNKTALSNLQLEDTAIELKLSISRSLLSSEKINDIIMLRMGISKISSRYKEIIILRYFEGLSFREISSILNLSYEATKSLFRRAISSLRKSMGEDTH